MSDLLPCISTFNNTANSDTDLRSIMCSNTARSKKVTLKDKYGRIIQRNKKARYSTYEHPEPFSYYSNSVRDYANKHVHRVRVVYFRNTYFYDDINRIITIKSCGSKTKNNLDISRIFTKTITLNEKNQIIKIEGRISKRIEYNSRSTFNVYVRHPSLRTRIDIYSNKHGLIT